MSTIHLSASVDRGSQPHILHGMNRCDRSAPAPLRWTSHLNYLIQRLIRLMTFCHFWKYQIYPNIKQYWHPSAPSPAFLPTSRMPKCCYSIPSAAPTLIQSEHRATLLLQYSCGSATTCPNNVQIHRSLLSEAEVMLTYVNDMNFT